MLTNRHQLVAPHGERVVKTIDDEALDILGATTERLDKRRRTELRPWLVQFIAISQNPGRPNQARRPDNDAGGAGLRTAVRAIDADRNLVPFLRQ
ncbi:hypothetical protein [Rhizobium sp. AB2/73]|uniref:hypothetical protein n=1 Tax=Rhizobium sp. AB2/73 TaxID=2795216 RepID=UPI001E46ED8E|nr:hypothetical protein [Rhizobium sp. AB2/73]